ncbi:MAG: hypothetical protein KJ737_14395 [Proteobacteria bacterium]|nr:hypothetical protein [Pseudomonadota bacterium]
MHTIYADKKKNRLYLTLDDVIEEDIPLVIKNIAKEVDQLQNDFSCLVDIRNLRLTFTDKEADYINIIQGALKDSGMSKVVRVVGEESFNKFTHSKMNEQSRNIGYEAIAVATLKEAEAILDDYKSSPSILK